MKIVSGPVLAVLLSLAAHAQSTSETTNIDKLCGCFDVVFKYAETFSPDPAYKYRERELMAAKELALPIERSNRKIVIQHFLVMDDTTVIKHWREDWTYEQPYLWKYEGERRWMKQELKPEQYQGKWTQTVWEVDDAPRYQGISEWVTTDGKTFWQSTVDAPVPRRDYTVRNDYNILRRGNRIVLTADGWTHEQDNDKVVKSETGEKLIAQEKGYNSYTRASGDCAVAKRWWERNSAFWNSVRAEWTAHLASLSSIQLQAQADNKRLIQYFDELFAQWQKGEVAGEAVTANVKRLLQKFVPPASASTARN